MAISPITVGDTAARTKINQAITEANKVAGKADAADLTAETSARVVADATETAARQSGDAALHDRIDAEEAARKSGDAAAAGSVETERADRIAADAAEQEARIAAVAAVPKFGEGISYPSRPGEAPRLFTADLTGAIDETEPLDASLAAVNQGGKVVRLVGEQTIAPRQMTRIEPDHLFQVIFAVWREINTEDPASDAVRCAIQWLDRGGTGRGVTVIEEIKDLTVGSGRAVVTAVVAGYPGEGIDHVAPSGAVYMRPFVQTWGDTQATDVEVIEVRDITGVNYIAPNVSGVTSRVTALETIDAGNRLDVVESALDAPATLRFASRSAAMAAPVSETVDQVETLGYASGGDGGRALYRRSAGEPEHAGKFQSLDGAWWELARGQILWLEAFGAKADDDTFDNTDAINAAWKCSSLLDLQIRGRAATYWHSDTLIVPKWAQFYGVIGQTILALAEEANCTQLETEGFDTYNAADAYELSDYPDLPVGFDFREFVLHGNRENQSPSSLVYGARLYGRRYIWLNVQITDQAGVSFWTKQGGQHDDFDFTDVRLGKIDGLNITKSTDEAWIFQGPHDIAVGTVTTNESGDLDESNAPRTSRFFSGEELCGMVSDGALFAHYLNLNSNRSGRCFHARSSRQEIDTLVAAGGWGNALISENVWGKIKYQLSQANPYSYSGVVHPHIENLSDNIEFGSTLIRRVRGQDQADALGVLDSGGANWESVQSRQAISELGTLFEVDANGTRIGYLKAVGVDVALHTTANCHDLSVNCKFANVNTVWKNDRTAITGDFKFLGSLQAGQVFGTGLDLSGSPSIDKPSLCKADINFIEDGVQKTNSYQGNLSIDSTSTGGKFVQFDHTLWYTPTVEMIQVSLRHNGFSGGEGTFSGPYVNGFNATNINARLVVETAASGTPTTQIVCRVN